MKLYGGIDLHSNNNLLIIDEQDNGSTKNDYQTSPMSCWRSWHRFTIVSPVLRQKATFNWYWLVDALMDNGYTTHLANPAAIQR
jgi:hypothetical protein